MKPYYEDTKAGIVIYHGDCREVLPTLQADVMVTDPPYGISHASNRDQAPRRRKTIQGDATTVVRDQVVAWWNGRPFVVFGMCKAIPPVKTRATLVWDKTEIVGMGDLSLPWKPNWEHIYIGGTGFTGHRGSGVLRFAALAPDLGLYIHPNQKPVELLRALIQKCPPGVILDPFMGSGTTLRAAKDLGRKAIGIEIEEKYCEIAVKRLSQEVLAL